MQIESLLRELLGSDECKHGVDELAVFCEQFILFVLFVSPATWSVCVCACAQCPYILLFNRHFFNKFSPNDPRKLCISTRTWE